VWKLLHGEPISLGPNKPNRPDQPEKLKKPNKLNRPDNQNGAHQKPRPDRAAYKTTRQAGENPARSIPILDL
jgi:hypothetical protein